MVADDDIATERGKPAVVKKAVMCSCEQIQDCYVWRMCRTDDQHVGCDVSL